MDKSIDRLSTFFAGLLAIGIGIAPEPVVGSEARTTTSEHLWESYRQNPNDHSHLPNNSYAGVNYGETPLPDAPVVVSVTDFGAIGDDQTDNSPSFEAAVEAAYLAGGGAVFIPEGTYHLSDPLWLHRSGVVIRGAGPEKTVLRFTRPLLDSVGHENPMGTNIWAWSGGLVWMSPRDEVIRKAVKEDAMDLETRHSHQGYKSSSSTWEYWREHKAMTHVMGSVDRGELKIEVEDVSSLQPGQFIMLTYENTPELSLLKEIGQSEPFQNWNRFGQWFFSDHFPRWQWPTEIESIDGNILQLREPLRVAIRPEFGVQVWDPGPVLRNSGLEDLTITMDGEGEDFGWNGVFLNRTLHCWVRNVTVRNGANGFHISASKNITLLDTRVESDRWMHHPYTLRTMSSNVLVENFHIDISEDKKRGTHGINTEFLTSGNVWSRGEMNRGTFDTHRGMPFDFIRTEIRLRNEKNSNPGGSAKAGAYSGRRTVHWNVKVTGDGNKGNYVYQPDTHTFGALVGIQGVSLSNAYTWNSRGNVMPDGDKEVLVADEGVVPSLPNLYEAQKAFRESISSWAHVIRPFREVQPPGQSMEIEVSGNLKGSRISEAVFTLDGKEIGRRQNPPWRISWTPDQGGIHELTAEILGENGHSATTTRSLVIGQRIRLEGEDPQVLKRVGKFEEDKLSEKFYGGKSAYTTTRNSSLEFQFTGTRFEIYSDGEKSHKSSAVITLNGEQVADVDVRGKAGYRHRMFDSGKLKDQEHTVRIVNERNRMSIDAVIITTTQ